MTNGKISKLLKDEDRSDVMLALLNATYFCGNWAYPFEKESTMDYVFNCENGNSSKIPFMWNSTIADYGKNDLFRAINLDFGNQEAKYNPYTMTCILPEEGHNLTEVLDWLGANSIKELDGIWSHVTNLNLCLPKFELENSLDLGKTLQTIGMKVPFTSEQADFSGIAGKNNPLFISKVTQGNKFGINENGAVGSSVTVAEMMCGSNPDSEIPTFHATRPFLFMVREKGSNAILFMGCIRNL